MRLEQALGLEKIGIGAGKVINYNLTYEEIAEHEDRGVQGEVRHSYGL